MPGVEKAVGLAVGVGVHLAHEADADKSHTDHVCPLAVPKDRRSREVAAASAARNAANGLKTLKYRRRPNGVKVVFSAHVTKCP